VYIGHKAVCPECGSEWWGWSVKDHPICDKCGAKLIILERGKEHEALPSLERKELK
jgi:DNA-directed RNA polymerase subunit RPC12/RpoP